MDTTSNTAASHLVQAFTGSPSNLLVTPTAESANNHDQATILEATENHDPQTGEPLSSFSPPATALLRQLLTTLSIPPTSIPPLLIPTLYTTLTFSHLESLALSPRTITPTEESLLTRTITELTLLSETNLDEVLAHLTDFMREPEKDYNWLLAWTIKVMGVFKAAGEGMWDVVLGHLRCEAEGEIGVERWRVVLLRGVRMEVERGLGGVGGE